MIFDFNLATQLRLSAVKRWGIVEMSRQQSVAEHSYNVALIALNLVGASVGHKGFSKEDESLLLTLCLVHDMPEVFSGDIPSTIKGAFKEELDDWDFTLMPMRGRLISLVFISVFLVSMVYGGSAMLPLHTSIIPRGTYPVNRCCV